MKLKVKIFDHAGQVTDFVNANGVEIQSIAVKACGEYVLFYWE